MEAKITSAELVTITEALRSFAWSELDRISSRWDFDPESSRRTRDDLLDIIRIADKLDGQL